MNYVVGVAYEGNKDIEVIKIIIERLGKLFGYNLTLSTHRRGVINAHTVIIKLLKSYTEYMFNEARVDYAFYFTDQDTDPDDRRVKILNKIKLVDPGLLSRACVGVANPCFEKWLLADEDIVKKVLKYNANKALPHKLVNPKDRFQMLVRESSVDILPVDAKVAIANNMSFTKLCKQNNGFKELYESVKKYVGNTEQ